MNDSDSKSSTNANHTSKLPKKCPEETANLLSRLTYWWANSLFTTGYKNTLTEDDLWELRPEERAEVVSRQLEVNWRREFSPLSQGDGSKRKSFADNWKGDCRLLLSVWKVLIGTFGWTYLVDTALTLVSTLISFAHPQLLKLFFAFVAASASSNSSDNSENSFFEALLHNGYFIVLLFLATSLLEQTISQLQSRISSSVSDDTMFGFASLLYKKSLSLDSSTRRKTTSGELSSLLSTGSLQMTNVVSSLNQLWLTPLEIAIALYFLWLEVGGAGDLVAVTIILTIIPLNVWIRGKEKASYSRLTEKEEERVRLTTEFVSGVRLLKYYAWEVPFARKIHSAREEELVEIGVSHRLGLLISFIWSVAPFAVSLATFSVYLLLGAEQRSLTAGKVFVSLSLFSLLRAPLRNLPHLWVRLARMAVSVKKVTAFLNSEMEFYVKNEEDKVSHVKFDSATLAWERKEKEEAILKEISLKVKRGSLVAVVGSVGVGKSSLLSAILGDMELLSGSVALSTEKPGDSIGYVAQQAWIQNATIRDNILFGEEFQEERYQQIIEDCALVEDLRQLPAGDMTEIGEKGINLSGGQKHRLALARACYSSTAALYLLDDPLAAVDSHVASHIFKRVISNQDGLLKDKTRILVTSSVTFLPEVDQIVLMEGGQITQIGTYEELITKASFADFVKKKVQFARQQSYQSQASSENADVENKEEQVVKKEVSDGLLIEEEKAKTSRVALSVYHSYFRSLSYSAITLCGLLFTAEHLSSTGSKVWLAFWSSENGMLSSDDSAEEGKGSGLTSYGVLGLLAAAFFCLGSFSIVRSGLRSASTIHRKLLDHLSHLPMTYFDRTPIGRTINLISGNMTAIDYTLPSMIQDIFTSSLTLATNLLLICLQLPAFLFFFAPAFALYGWFESFHKVTSRQLEDLYYRTYSPIYSAFDEAHLGMATIRALKAEERFQAEIHRRLDVKRQTAFAQHISYAWGGQRTAFLGTLLELAVKLMIVARLTGSDSVKSDGGSGSSVVGSGQLLGYIGLLLSQSASITSAHYLLEMFSWLDASMASVERIEECLKVKTEDEWEKEDEQALEGQEWPSRGEIQFVDYSVRYREGLELVLKEVNLEIQAGEKVGIVGRTGAGKSTMTLALFRILEPSAGKIVIDGVDIASVGLHRLRRGLAIIPQDPTLFSGTIRSNLDPFGVYTDERLMEALTQCHLKKVIDSTDLGLDSVVAENGTNFSVGEKQLLCAARALLVGAKILVLDEATSAVDPKTDSLIGETIRTAFAHCTVLTIAHRLNSILEADRVMVVEAGRIVEFAPPSVLLANRKSAFYSLAKDANLV